MKYVFKRVLIGVLLFLIIGFLKNTKVFASVVKLGLVNCPVSSGVMFCNSNENVIQLYDNSDFTINSSDIIKNLYVDYSGQTFNSGRYTLKFDNPIFLPTDNSLNIENFYFKNLRPISCTYNDGVSAERQSCLDFFYYYDYYFPYLVPFEVATDSGVNELRYGAKSYVYHNSYVPEQNLPNMPYGGNDISFFVIPSGVNVTDMVIKFGGVGTFSGNLNNLFSGYYSSSVNNYYLDYPIISGKTFSTAKKITFHTFQNMNKNNFILQRYNYSLPNFLSQLNVTELSGLINNVNGASELEKDFAIQDRLIGYDKDSVDEKSSSFVNTIGSSIESQMGGVPTLFYDFLALPINMLRENANYELYQDPYGTGDLTCTNYASNVINGSYSSVYGSINLTIPFTHNTLTLDCTNVDVLSPYNRNFGSYHNEDSDKGLDKTLRPIWHIILSGLLSYRLIVCYFKLIKDMYDPDDMSIEVLDL